MQNWNDDRLDHGFREMREANTALREEMKEGFAELRTDNARLGAELRQELKDATAELRTDNARLGAELRQELKDATAELREENKRATAELREENRRATTELREEMRDLRGEMVAGFARIDSRLDRQNYTLIAALVAIVAALLSGLFG